MMYVPYFYYLVKVVDACSSRLVTVKSPEEKTAFEILLDRSTVDLAEQEDLDIACVSRAQFLAPATDLKNFESIEELLQELRDIGESEKQIKQKFADEVATTKRLYRWNGWKGVTP